MDRIDAFRVLVRVVETGSFSKAAADLGVTQPTVTRQVAALEQRLGGRLLNRNTRRLSVTELGRQYYEKTKTLLDYYGEIEKLAQGQNAPVRGRLRIGSSVAFGRRVVTPLILRFMREYPEIEVDLSFEDIYVDLVAQGVDVAIRLGKLADSSLGARFLGLNPWTLVAAPDYLRRRGTPKLPQDLVRHDVLVYSSVQGDDHLNFTDRKSGHVSVAVRGPLRANNLSAILAAVRDGMGIAALPMYVANASLESGHVVRLLTASDLPSQEMHAVYPSPKLVPAKVNVLIEFLRDAFSRNDWYTGQPPSNSKSQLRKSLAGNNANGHKA